MGVVGPFGFKIITDEILITDLGSLGLVLLLFFVGMKIHLPTLVANWKVSVIGTFVQIVMSIIIVWFLGQISECQINQVIMLGFVISLSNTTLVVKLLQKKKVLF